MALEVVALALIFVDCEAVGPCPSMGTLTEFGAVDYTTRDTFHGVLYSRDGKDLIADPNIVFGAFETWISAHVPKGESWSGRMVNDRPIFVSDNPAWDFQWITDGFWTTLGRNPFGHSGRRISDFYAGLVGDFQKAVRWKRLRVTPHDHHPVHDAMGNVEAFERMLKGER